mgnify:CR=1 FL=1
MGLLRRLSHASEYSDLVKHLAIRDLKLRYERSALGFLWTLVNPLVMIGIYSFVFSMVIRMGVDRFPLFLVPVLLPWNFLVRCISVVAPIIWQSGYLINRASFPSESLIFSGMLSAFSEFCLEMGLFVLILVLMGAPIFPGALILPLVMLMHLVFVTGVVFFFALGFVYYRDTQYISPIIMTAWFFLTPVFYPVSYVPEQYRFLYQMNPAVHIAACFRDPLYSGTLPPWSTLGIAAAFSISLFVFGWILFTEHKHEFAEVI